MEITILGYLAILLTIIILIFGKRLMFLYAAVFFSGFSGASIINVLGNSIQPSFYFLAIYCVLIAFSSNKLKIRIDSRLIIFFCYCLISLLNTLIFNNVEIMNQDGKYSLNVFSISNLIHILYLFIALLFFNELLRYTNNEHVKSKFVKIYKLGLFSVILICLYQILAFKFDLPFDVLFRQNPNGNVQGNRLYGPCIEASMLCYYLLPSMLLVFLTRQGIFDWLLIISSFFLGISTMSSTFLIGLLLIMAVAVCYLIFNFNKIVVKLRWYHLLCFITILFLCLVFSKTILSLFNTLIDKLLQKNTSGIERMDSFLNMFKVGIIYPFGVGFGSGRSKDLLSTWICNIGVFGILLFIIYLLHYIGEARRANSLFKITPFILVICLMMIAVPEPYNLFIWYLAFFGTNCKTKKYRIKLNNLNVTHFHEVMNFGNG